MDQIKSQVDNLSQLSDEQLAELQQSIVTEFDSVSSTDPTAESVDAMTSLADMLDACKGEAKRASDMLEVHDPQQPSALQPVWPILDGQCEQYLHEHRSKT